MAKIDHVAELKAMAADPLSSYDVNVGGEIYTVRRKDFITISDAAGRALLVRPAAIPDVFVVDLIMAYRTGRSRGRIEARRELRDALEDE